jgi:hypothetical protein
MTANGTIRPTSNVRSHGGCWGKSQASEVRQRTAPPIRIELTALPDGLVITTGNLVQVARYHYDKVPCGSLRQFFRCPVCERLCRSPDGLTMIRRTPPAVRQSGGAPHEFKLVGTPGAAGVRAGARRELQILEHRALDTIDQIERAVFQVGPA